jgi:hypothetical protein
VLRECVLWGTHVVGRVDHGLVNFLLERVELARGHGRSKSLVRCTVRSNEVKQMLEESGQKSARARVDFSQGDQRAPISFPISSITDQGSGLVWSV